MTRVTCRLTAKDRNQLRNPTLGNRVWATFLHPSLHSPPSLPSTFSCLTGLVFWSCSRISCVHPKTNHYDLWKVCRLDALSLATLMRETLLCWAWKISRAKWLIAGCVQRLNNFCAVCTLTHCLWASLFELMHLLILCLDLYAGLVIKFGRLRKKIGLFSA